jgi:arylsulfatase
MSVFVVVIWASVMEGATPLDRPNIIVILVDDMGFSDLGCYGSEIPTPHLDDLAEHGLRFTQFYNTARCCPTRASLLTGLYPHQAGVGHMTDDKGVPGYQGRLNNSCVTIAEVLQPAGYFTAMTGKWHVGQNLGVTPWGRGFTRSLNAPAGGFYFPDSSRAELFLNGQVLAKDDPRLPKDWYSTDLWTTFGLKFIDEALAADKPFYLHLCHNAPHFPLQAPADEVARFRNKYRAGWEALRAERVKRQLQLGLLDPAWRASVRPEAVKLWTDLTSEEQDRFDHIMAVYAAVVHHMDKAIGDLVAGLKQRGVLENTLIFFLSDNGGNAESGPEGRTQGDPTRADSNWFCGESWAFLENSPFRLYKHYNHEGGIATPLIVHWPQGISAQGELRHQPGHLVDIMATCVEVAKAEYPRQFRGSEIQPMEGTSLVPAFNNRPLVRDALYWEHEGNAAVRVGDRKLVRQGRNGAWELYDLKADRSEQNNLASTFPAVVQELAAKWDAWAKRTHVIPYPEAAGTKKKSKGTKKQ